MRQFPGNSLCPGSYPVGTHLPADRLFVGLNLLMLSVIGFRVHGRQPVAIVAELYPCRRQPVR
jgi:hypothetical protein